MKKLFFALLVAATALVGCGPDNSGNGNGNGNGNGGDKPFYGILIDQAMFTNRGDYYNQDNGTSNYILRFSTLGEVDGEEMAVAYLTLELDVTLDENGRIPEGTYSVANGDIYPGEVMNLTTGTFYVDFTQQSIENAYMFATSGELEVKHLNETDYQITITLKGKNYNGGQGTPYEGRYEGEPAVVGLGATSDSYVRADDFVGAEGLYLGATEDGATALWQISMYDEGYYELVTKGGTEKLPAKYVDFFLICENKGPEALPKGTFAIDMLSTYSDNTVLEAAYTVIESYEFDAENNTVIADFSVNDILTDGYVKINPQGTTTLGSTEWPLYKFDVVGYGIQDAYKLYYNDIVYLYEQEPDEVEPIHFGNITLVEALYWGEQPANEAGTIMTKPLWYLQYTMQDEKYGEMMMMMELFTNDGNTFEQGIPSGTYTVATLDENLDIAQPNYVFPGYYTTNNSGALNRIYGTYIVGGFVNNEETGQKEFTLLYDCVQGGTLEVVNNGDGTYKMGMDFVGSGIMTFDSITGNYEGGITAVDGTALGEDTQVAAKQATKSQNNNKVELAGEKRFKVEARSIKDNRKVKTQKSTLFERNFR